ncbi:hypothetical protein GOBAR_DD19358 [Gossypium barbadense]|nr:hypothetical protein GOBAR_DD19358 [Gossypium barbadense]
MPAPSSNSQAYVATPDTVGDHVWFPDSEVTHHPTHFVTSMSYNTPYNGSSMVYVGNGAGSQQLLLSNSPSPVSDPIKPIVPSDSSQPSSIVSSESRLASPNIVNTHPMVTRNNVGTFKPKIYHAMIPNLSETIHVDVHKEMMYLH